MKTKFINMGSIVSIEGMLSSTTYPVYGSFNHCVYCDSDVENDYMEYNYNFYQPLRCCCEKAKEELKIKLEVIRKFEELDKLNEFIDADSINKYLYTQEVDRLKEEYNIDQPKEKVYLNCQRCNIELDDYVDDVYNGYCNVCSEHIHKY